MTRETHTFWITCLLLVGGAALWHFEPAAADTVKMGWAAVVGHWLGRNGAKTNGGGGGG